MKKILILLFFCNTMFSQTLVEKWNDYYNRYEFFDSKGNMIAYKKYNTLLRQWETYNVNNTQTKSIFNAELADKALAKEQKAYDDGKRALQTKINEIYRRISETFDSENDHGFVKMVQNTYYNEVVVPLANKGIDYSKKSNLDNALDYLENNYEWALNRVIAKMEQMSKK
jgi:tRNA A37 N6-isopentenylltransferase MiaA